jgi:CDP-glycerol glycerophosphotransferase (TagB/SpsB family)/glycosyltransferase involved in cell wall biosynthesis
MAIYNVESYLEEAIESVIRQTLDFRRHVQLILVNDGSPDNSDAICRRYQAQYPDNIVYVHKKNGGVSSARNEGLKHVRGKYVNFLDADDKLSENTLYEVFSFFEKNYDEVDIVSIPIFFFEGQSGPHILNYKFQKTRVIDILKEYDMVQLSSSSAFIKAAALHGVSFNEQLHYAEDAEFLNRIILRKCTLGVLQNATYYYRRRLNEGSAIQQSTTRKEWYTQSLKNFSLGSIKYAIEEKQHVPKYIQYTVMYDLQWKFNVGQLNVLDGQERLEFFEMIREVLSYIDDEIILQQRHMNIHRKHYVLSLKHGGRHHYQKVFVEDNVLLYHGNRFVQSLKEQPVTIEILEIKGSIISLEGIFGSLFLKEEIELVVQCNGKEYVATSVDRPTQCLYSLGNVVKDFYGFKVDVKLDILEKKIQSLKFYARIQGAAVPVGINMGKFSKLSHVQGSYYAKGNFIVCLEDDQLIIKKNSRLSRFNHELKLLNNLYKLNQEGSRKAILARIAYRFLKTLSLYKEIWLFMDRQDKADDNAEHLFKYAVTQRDKCKKYFVVRKNSPDYNRMKQHGKVIPFGSYRHKLMQLAAAKIISSHADDLVLNPFYTMEKYYRDLMDFDFIFLQHGIILHDLSKWLNRYNKNIKMFVTSAKPEYESILQDNYQYDHHVVKLVGLPRYDNLLNRDQKQILIMPTWRKGIVSEIDPNTGLRPYNKAFKFSEYFRIYNALINDHRLLEASKKHGYRIVFFPHPNIHQQLCDFDKNSNVQFIDYHSSYQQLFNESSMLVTDFSSVAFDVAYLKKPIVYFHGIDNHHEKGYFNYETMGFGEICHDYDTLVSVIIEYIENGCRMKDKYIKRVETFYAYMDQKNCERVYNEIIGLE